MNQSLQATDKTTRAMEEIRRWKEAKRKGELRLHFDGSGDLKAIKAVIEVK